MCEFWKTFSTLKSETIWTYINKKKDIKEEINRPLAAMAMNFDFNLLFFRDMKNWKIEKNKDKQSEKFPKDAAIS